MRDEYGIGYIVLERDGYILTDILGKYIPVGEWVKAPVQGFIYDVCWDRECAEVYMDSSSDLQLHVCVWRNPTLRSEKWVCPQAVFVLPEPLVVASEPAKEECSVTIEEGDCSSMSVLMEELDDMDYTPIGIVKVCRVERFEQIPIYHMGCWK